MHPTVPCLNFKPPIQLNTYGTHSVSDVIKKIKFDETIDFYWNNLEKNMVVFYFTGNETWSRKDLSTTFNHIYEKVFFFISAICK